MKHLIAALLTLTAPSVQAKCANELYTFTGKVAAQDSAPISDALVAVAWNETVHGTTLERTAHTDSTGRYSVELPFYPWSGNKHGTDLCNAKLTDVAVLVAAPGFAEQQTELSVEGSQTTANYSLKRIAASGGGVD